MELKQRIVIKKQARKLPPGLLVFMAPRVGLEPTTYRLTADRSTIELWRIIAYSSAIGVKFQLAPQVGLEPTTLRLTAECSAIELPRNVRLISDA